MNRREKILAVLEHYRDLSRDYTLDEVAEAIDKSIEYKTFSQVIINEEEDNLDDPHFDGDAYDKSIDQLPLTGQLLDIFHQMMDGKWYTLARLERATGHQSSSISAQLRNMRKPRFGSHTIEKERFGESRTWWYRLIPNESSLTYTKYLESQHD